MSSSLERDLFKDIYASFDGVLPQCPGYRCSHACCRNIQVVIFEAEKKHLISHYGKSIENRIQKAEDGFYFLHDCSDGKNCRYFEHRPLLCRTYPCAGIMIPKDASSSHSTSSKLIFALDTLYCPVAPNPKSLFVQQAKEAWKKIADFYGYSFVDLSHDYSAAEKYFFR